MKTARRIFLAGLAAALSACSLARVAYDNADAPLAFMAKEYFDLDGAQSAALKARLARLHAWHRENELPVYAALLREASRRAQKGITAEDVAWSLANLRARYRRLAAQAAEDLAPVLATLGTAQIAALEHKFAESNEKYAREYLPDDPKKRRRAQVERAVERFEDFTGDLRPDQQARIERFVAAHEAHVLLRFEDRRHWQRDALELLREHRAAPDLGDRLAELFIRPESRRSAEFVREDRRWEDDLAQLIADLDRTLTPRQRARVVRRLDGYAEDCAALAGQKKESA